MKKTTRKVAGNVGSVDSYKNKHFIAQMKACAAEFKRKPQTMKMVSVATGIDRGNICWYVDDWQDAGLIAVYKVGECPITKHPTVNFYTMNPALMPPKQPTLFDGIGGSEL